MLFFLVGVSDHIGLRTSEITVTDYCTVTVIMNPVRARLTRRAAEWRWSSARALLGLVDDDGVTAKAPVLERYPDFAALVEAGEDEALSQRLRRAETIGRPLGTDDFVARLERASGRVLKPARRGPKPKLNALSP